MAFIGENRVKVNAEAAMQHLMDSEAPVESAETAKKEEEAHVEKEEAHVEKEEAHVEKEVEKEVPVDGENHEEVEL